MVRIFFAGTPTFAVPSLLALTDDPAFDVRGVITQPDRPVGRKGLITPPAVKVAAMKLGIPVYQPETINDDAITSLLKREQCDVLVVVAFGQILHTTLLETPRIGVVNVHASLLPRWRGASPIQHAILTGDTMTGITIQKMVEALDEGPILAQEALSIGPRETFTELHDRLAEIGARLLADTLKKPWKEQAQSTDGVTMCTKLRRESGCMDPLRHTAVEIDRAVRALCPWPGVQVTLNGSPAKILETTLQESPQALRMPCAQGTTLFVQKIQSPGGNPLSGMDWYRNRR